MKEIIDNKLTFTGRLNVVKDFNIWVDVKNKEFKDKGDWARLDRKSLDAFMTYITIYYNLTKKEQLWFTYQVKSQAQRTI